MTTCFLLPDPVQSTFFIPGGNTPGNGVQVGFFLAGSSTPVTVYKDPAAAVAWSNPIVLDSGGNLPLGGEVWVPSGTTVKVTWAPSNDVFPPVSPYRTMENLSGINDVSSSSTDWVTGPTPTFVSATSFTLAGDQRLNFNLGRRIKSTNTGGTIFSTVTSVTFGVVTTVNVVNDSGSLDAGLSAVFYGLIDPAFSSIDAYHIDKKAAAVTSAANGTTNIWGIAGNYVHVIGTNAIFSFSTAPYAGAAVDVTFDGALSLNSSAAISMPGNANVTTSANDRIRVRAETVSTASIMMYQSGFNASVLQGSNTVFSGPVSGSALPAFRLLVGAQASHTLLLSRTLAVASSNINITSTDIDFTAYNEYEIHLNQFRPTNNAAVLSARYSHDGGVTFNSSATYSASQVGIDSSGSTTNVASNTQTSINLTSLGVSQGQTNVSTFAAAGTLKIFNPNDSPRHKLSRSEFSYINQGSSTVNLATASHYTGSTAAINGLSFLYTPGNVSSGSLQIIGIRTS